MAAVEYQKFIEANRFFCWVCDNCFSAHLDPKVIKLYNKTIYCSVGAKSAVWRLCRDSMKTSRSFICINNITCRSFALSLPKNLQKHALERIRSHKMWPKGFSFLFSPVEFCSWCDKNCSTSIISWVCVSWKIYLAYGNILYLSFSGKISLSFLPDLVSRYKHSGVTLHINVGNCNDLNLLQTVVKPCIKNACHSNVRKWLQQTFLSLDITTYI